MRITETSAPGVFLIHADSVGDERGSFARLFCRREFEKLGLNPTVNQCSISRSSHIGTLRGMHYQAEPHAEAKLVRCTRGAIYDVALDLRPNSPSHKRWFGVELTARDATGLYIPKGYAHGFITLEPDSEVSYQMSDEYVPSAARGVRYDDSAFGIVWPTEIRVISERDRAYPDYQP